MAATVTEAVKESLIGTERSPLLSNEAKRAFEQYAKHQSPDGARVMDREDFVNAIAPPGEDYHKIKREQYGILFEVADRRKLGYLDIKDWARFEHLLAKPDAEYEIAFRLFDTDGNGTVEWKEFVDFYNKNRGPDSIPFDWNSSWASLYVGGKKSRHDLTYPQFAQMMRALQGEKVRQAFHHFDKNETGFIEPEQFQRIILESAGHKLSDHLLENLYTLCNLGVGSKISYANVRAFQNIVNEMDIVDTIVRNATAKSPDGKIDRTDFLNEAARVTRFLHFTPMEADILFHFAGLETDSGRLSLKDFSRVIDPLWKEPTMPEPKDSVGSLPKIPSVSTGQGIVGQILVSAYNFGLGAVAGAFGATVVYPIDLVKTRMQNQRSQVGEMLYKNSLDCARKVIRNEGFRGLYSGLGPQLIGVAPEKAIKLTVNDLVRRKAPKREDGSLSLPWELFAGGSAGACQVVFTNPLEIVKIRLQVQGEISTSVENAAPRRSALWIVRNLGVVGLYKGASACLLRDVPFSAIYFPAYAHLKKDYFGESPTKSLGILQLLSAGAIAGMPAAYFTTPCDVIKTRLQVEARKGQTSYRGLVHCATTIWKEEGFKAFFKGGPARILRSSPQFGCTLAAYELLQTLFPFPGSGKKDGDGGAGVKQIGLVEDRAPLPLLRSRNALKIILDLDQNFGKHNTPQQPHILQKWSGASVNK
ncbi:putative mitochondrial carrier protein [Ascodesmis nigricans]|uniref:Mitochondrial aspartate-glutamate transporter AGC1 n=1 Tax=Ascodesmis nigricans TaxID=341454 RepID=A0A4S2N7K1_9PEZI|nr:putative mitochondrial carrier protein [Ascodesmis nigricans]